MSRILPQHPNLEFLRKQAKSLLVEMQQRNAATQLSEAQQSLAREYGFASWPKLKAFVDAQAAAGTQSVSAFTGTWMANLEQSKQHPGNPFRSAIIEIDVLGDRFTITDTVIDETGREETATHVIQADGKPHSSSDRPEYSLVATLHGQRVLEIVATKGGDVVGRGRYEVSSDGAILRISDGDDSQLVVLDRVT
jgi:hypothetical protein